MNFYIKQLAVGIAFLIATIHASAWTTHALSTWQALGAMPEMERAPQVKVESLGSFLVAEAAGLEKLLEQEEQWARRNVPFYPPRPDAIAFKKSDGGAPLKSRFIAALRINPDTRLTLFLQLRLGQAIAGRPVLPWTKVTPLLRDEEIKQTDFLHLRDGDPVAPLDVIATASDEPDYGMDIGVWEDNGTPHGKTYQLGKQSFGNPTLEYSSQAPLHMGFYHESAIIYAAAGFLNRTFPEARIHLYRSLSTYAFRTGHSYWGWRFAGWGLHYSQDLTQPYHARVLPGVSVPRMLWINALDLARVRTPKEDAIMLVSNRHKALENYQYNRVRQAYLRGTPDDALMRSMRDTSTDGNYAPYADGAPRGVIARESHALADATDRALERTLPAKYISDPSYVFDETEPRMDLYARLDGNQMAHEEMASALSPLMRHLGAHSRSFVRAFLGDER